MKRKRSIIAMFLCAMLAFAAVFPAAMVSADTIDNVLPGMPVFKEKIRAFLDQKNIDGVTNGELMCAQLIPEYGFETINYIPGDDSSLCELLKTPYFGGGRFSLSVYADAGMDYAGAYLNPPLVGTLDLSDTEIDLLEDSVAQRCMIRSINLNNCKDLSGIVYTSPTLRELHALGTDLVGAIIESNLDVLELQLRPSEEPICIDVIGGGSFSFNYNSHWGNTTVHPFSESVLVWKEPEGASTYSVKVTNGEERFLGWYSGGKLVCKDIVYVGEADEGAHLTAVFKGDANGDGTVDSSDALAIMRSMLGIEKSPCKVSVCDMDGSRTVDSSDALMLLRFTLGIL